MIQSWDIHFKSQECTLRPVLKACINSLQIPGPVHYISNNIKRWTSDLNTKCKPHFLSTAPEGFFPVSVNILFKDLFDLLIPIQQTGSLVVSNESKVSNGQVFEINIELKPVIIPTRKLKDYKIELFLEYVVNGDSVEIEYIFGNSWIVFSVSSEFLGLCQELVQRNFYLICSCEYDLDEDRESSLPLFYVLIPSTSMPYNMLLRKILSKESVRNIILPPLSLTEDNSNNRVSKFIFDSFEAVEFTPRLLCNGLHQYLSLKALQNTNKAEMCVSRSEDKEIESIVRNFTGSIKKKRGRRTKEC